MHVVLVFVGGPIGRFSSTCLSLFVILLLVDCSATNVVGDVTTIDALVEPRCDVFVVQVVLCVFSCCPSLLRFGRQLHHDVFVVALAVLSPLVMGLSFP